MLRATSTGSAPRDLAYPFLQDRRAVRALHSAKPESAVAGTDERRFEQFDQLRVDGVTVAVQLRHEIRRIPPNNTMHAEYPAIGVDWRSPHAQAVPPTAQ